MKVYKNKSLRNLNTFKIDVCAKYFVRIRSEKELFDIIDDKRFTKLPKLVLGGGSNILFRKNFEGLVVKNEIAGIEIIKKTKQYSDVKIGGGENWHNFVSWAVKNQLAGVENLALIAGTVGAAPVQNIAAYGQNLSDTFLFCEAINLKTKKKRVFGKRECLFSYRSSIFKTKLKDKYAITQVVLRLSKIPKLDTSYYQIGISYDSVEKELESVAKKPYKLKDVYKAVINIRKRKLPDPEIIPNVGSFFINPTIKSKKLKDLIKTIDELQYYPVEQLKYVKLDDLQIGKDKYFKVPAGRLLDELGWRGKKIGNCSISEKHALIVTHNGKASGNEVFEFVRRVKKDFFKNYNIKLESEVRII